jgi:hypothetical protein
MALLNPADATPQGGDHMEIKPPLPADDEALANDDSAQPIAIRKLDRLETTSATDVDN